MSLVIVGCGIDPSRHITAEAQRALSTADRVMTLMPKAWVARLPPEVSAHVESLFDEYYVTGRHRPSVYADVAGLLSDAAKTADIAYAVQGGPSWYDSIVTLLVDACAANGTACHLVAGVSAVEAVLTRLNQSVAPSLLITDAASVVDGHTTLDRRRPALIMQPHVAMTRSVASGVATSRATVEALGAALAATHPPEHEVTAVALPGEWPEERLFTVSIKDLQAGLDVDLRGGSLYLPQVD
jgi:uncharacterized protein YabN with tetrapyrrole methylase and pyrophosphatase domain